MHKYLAGVMVVVLLFVIALAVGGRGGGVVEAPAEVQEPMISLGTIAATTSAYVVDAQYPIFGLLAIDTQIKKTVEDVIAELEAAPPVDHDFSVATNSFTGLFESPYVDSEYVSVKLVLSSYTGGAHPNTSFVGQSFDKATGKRLVLADVLPLIGKSIEDLSASSTEMLKADLGEDFMFPEGAAANPDNFGSFLVSSSSVTFIFQQYQVTAYAFGPQEVSVPRVQ